MNNVVSGPRKIMDWTRKVAKAVSKSGHPLIWRTPSGFVVRQMRPQLTGQRVETRLGDTTVKLTLTHPTDKIDSRKQAQALAPNWIHSLDAAALHLTIHRLLGRGVEDISAIHDSYGTHAAHMDLMAGTLREVFVEMYRDDLIARFIEDVSKPLGGPDKLVERVKKEDRPIQPPPRGNLDVSLVEMSRYFFA
jgi:DNA-directed RNA polymerase